MGRYADSLAARLRGARKKPEPPTNVERLQSCAIKREGHVHSGWRSHYDVRADMGDRLPQTSNPNDVEGFLTTKGRFVTRAEAQDVAFAAGQINSFQGRPLLSSDIDW